MTGTQQDWLDYARIQTLIARYVWTLDTADIRALGALFTDEAIFEDTAGNVYRGRAAYEGYFRSLVARPEFRGRQHHIDNLILTPTAWGYETKSYWTVSKWFSQSNQKVLEVTGYSTDHFVRGGDGFLFSERRVHYWRDVDCPWSLN